MGPFKRGYMQNQRGEVVLGLMAVMMCVMMFFGGMHMMRGEHRSEEDRAQVGHKHGRDEGAQHTHDDVDEQAAVSDLTEDK